MKTHHHYTVCLLRFSGTLLRDAGPLRFWLWFNLRMYMAVLYRDVRPAVFVGGGAHRPALSLAPARPPVGGARDRCGTRGGGPAGWIPVGRRSAVPVPKFTKP